MRAAAEKNKTRNHQLIFPASSYNSYCNFCRWWWWWCWRLFIIIPLTATSTILLLPPAAAAAPQVLEQEIPKGFSISPSSSSSFQPILNDPSGNFSFGFLFLGPSNHQLDLAVVHVPSSLPLWRANANARGSHTTTLSFDGRLLLSDTRSGTLYWSPQPDGLTADRVLLLDTSNLQITTRTGAVIWQTFDFPSDTIVQHQNFTSKARLRNDRFSMRLGPNYLGLYLMTRNMYWKRTALQAKGKIVDGDGPIYARINAFSGYMAMYQREGPPADVMPFDSYNRNITAVYLRRLTLESNGNLRGYFWNGTSWVPDFKAISNMCDLPAPCGAYALCTQHGTTAGSCTCLHQNNNNHTTEQCFPEDNDDLCSSPSTGTRAFSDYWVLRKTGVDLAYKEFIDFTNMASLEQCETSCEQNCSCWGAIYGNGTGACYKIDFPIETLVAAGGEEKMGYFKVRVEATGGGGGRKTAAFQAGIAMLVIGLAIFIGIFAIVWRKRRWTWRRGRSMTEGSMLVEGLTPVPYKDIKDTSSFRSVELSLSSSSSSSQGK